jgi:hypothetical protein
MPIVQASYLKTLPDAAPLEMMPIVQAPYLQVE